MEKGLSEMKVSQLKEMAKGLGIKGYSKLNKGGLVDLLTNKPKVVGGNDPFLSKRQIKRMKNKRKRLLKEEKRIKDEIDNINKRIETLRERR